MVGLGAIELETGPWSSPVVLVKKKNSPWRFHVDYGQLNRVTSKDLHSLPCIDDAMEHVAGSAWFSLLGLWSGYQQVELAPKIWPNIHSLSGKDYGNSAICL